MKIINNIDLVNFKNLIQEGFPQNEDQYYDFDSYLYSNSMFEDFNLIEKYLYAFRIKTILDMGVGISLTSWYLSKIGFEVIGCDIEPEKDKLNMKQTFNQKIIWNRLKEERQKIGFVGVPPDELPFKDTSFDCILTYAVIEHVQPRYLEKWISEINRVLKKKGIIFIFKCPQKSALTENIARFLKIGSHEFLYTKNEINTLFENINCKKVYFKQEDFFPCMLTQGTQGFSQKIYDALGPLFRIIDISICLTPLKFFAHNLEFVFQKIN